MKWGTFYSVLPKNFNLETLDEYIYTIQSIIQRTQHSDITHRNLTTLTPLIKVDKKSDLGITKGMATKIASSGLTYGHFECVYKRDGEEGLKTLCKTKTNGKERVTKQKNIIDAIIKHFQ